MNSPASILFDINGNPVGVSGSMTLPTGALGQLVAAVDSGNNVQYLRMISGSLQVTGSLAIVSPVFVTSTGSLPTYERRSSTATTGSINASNSTSQILLNSNLNRLQGLVFNDSTGQLYLSLGPTASTSAFTVRIDSRGYYEIPFFYTGVVSGIWSNNNGAAKTTEIIS
jgi:hypothetical protein